MPTTLLDLYRQYRKPRSGTGVTDKGYYRYHYQPTAQQALYYARHELSARPLRALWDRLEESHLVRLRFEPMQECLSVNDIVGDCDHPRCCNGNAHPASARTGHRVIHRGNCTCRKPAYCKLCQRVLDIVDRDGITTAVTEYTITPCDYGPATDAVDCRKPSDQWEHADSLGMIIGTDLDPAYADDMKRACIDALRRALRSRVRVTASHTAGLVKVGAP